MISWQQLEFLLKGLYLGLLVMIAWLKPSWVDVAVIGLCSAGGLALFLGIAAWQKIRAGHQVQGRLLGFFIYLLLDGPWRVYAGLLLGLTVGAGLRLDIPGEALVPAVGGAALGGVLYALRYLKEPMQRYWAAFGVLLVVVGGAATMEYFYPSALAGVALDKIGWLLLIGIPGFYLLTFAGLTEESEAEIAALCAALGVALWALLSEISPAAGRIVILVPLGVFFVYSKRILPQVRVLKHLLRGISYRQMGQTRLALLSLGRALQLDPRNRLAQEQMWGLHRDLDFAHLQNQPDLVPFLNFDFCLERISRLLATRPSETDLRETRKMLDLIAQEAPARSPICAYWRAVAHLHERNYEDAASQLTTILQLPQAPSAAREAIHFAAWNLALFGHAEMGRRVAAVLLALPGQRMDAIAAAEAQLVLTPDDPAAWDLKRRLYSELNEAEYCSFFFPGQAARGVEGKGFCQTPSPPAPLPEGEGRADAAPRAEGEGSMAASLPAVIVKSDPVMLMTQPPPIEPASLRFNHEYVQQLGLALLDSDDWQRGCEYLRIAAHGLASRAPALYIQIAQAHEKHGDAAGMWANYQHAMKIGRALGVQNLAAPDKETLFATVKKIGDQAIAQNQIDASLEAYKFYSQNDSAGIETWRMLAELFERKAKIDEREHAPCIFQALHCTEHALSYNAEDADLLARKDRYYYSIAPAELQARLESVRKWFDPQYCRDKARWVLEKFNGEDFDLLDWASHLTELALIAQPGSHAARLLQARIRRLRGEMPETIALLEDIRQHRPEKFANDEEQKAWYYAHRLLGDLYLETKPADAVACFLEFRESGEAGADTSYKLGRAYEALGDVVRARKCYEAVTAYERHPLYYEARDGLERLKQGTAGNLSAPPTAAGNEGI